MDTLKIKHCKICFENDEDDITNSDYTNNNKQKNIMISVCNCKGSLKYIHFNCLSKWIESRLEFNVEYKSPINFKITLKNYYCELCKAELPCNNKLLKNKYISNVMTKIYF